MRTDRGIKNVSAAIVSLTIAILANTASMPQDVQLEGTWQYSRVNTKGANYSGNVVIDRSGQARDVTNRPSGNPVRQRGYVKVSGGNIDVIFQSVNESNYNPDHFRCKKLTDQALSCSNVDTAGSRSYTFSMVKISGPPEQPAPQPSYNLSGQQSWDECASSDPARSIPACSSIVDNRAESDESRADGFVFRGSAYFGKGDFGHAITDYSEALKLTPHNVTAFASRALAYYRQGRRDDAIADFRRADISDATKLRQMMNGSPELREIAAAAGQH